MQTNHFLWLKKFKNTESAQHGILADLELGCKATHLKYHGVQPGGDDEEPVLLGPGGPEHLHEVHLAVDGKLPEEEISQCRLRRLVSLELAIEHLRSA